MVWRSVCALGVVLGAVAHGERVSQIVERVWRSLCALMPFGACLFMVWICSDRGEGVAVMCGVSARSIEVARIVSEVRPAYQGIKYDIYIMC